MLALPVTIIFPTSGHTSTDLNSSTWSVSIDNDGILGTDKIYSNGLFLEYHSERVNNLALSSPWPYKIAGQLFFIRCRTNIKLELAYWSTNVDA
ncbi:TPA: lipid A-modifier LpxR family protein [Photobacterium damselae]